MVIGYPWAGRDWNGAIAISGRAAMPGLPAGSGFNWRSVAGTTGYTRPGRAARRGLRGLGQDVTLDDSGNVIDPNTGAIISSATASTPITSNPFACVAGVIGTGCGATGYTYVSPSSTPAASTSLPSVPTASSSSATPWYAGLLQSMVNVGGQITNYQLNPLTNKSTYIQTPQGGIIATNNPNVSTAGLTTSSMSSIGSLLPLLLIGGVALMMMKK